MNNTIRSCKLSGVASKQAENLDVLAISIYAATFYGYKKTIESGKVSGNVHHSWSGVNNFNDNACR